MAILGVGTDIIEIDRIAGTIERQGQAFLDRIFTSKEQEYCSGFQESARHYAGRFAAKESLSKALGTGIGQSLAWLDVEILPCKTGQPQVTLSSHALDQFGPLRIHLSISHCRAFATAVVLLETIEEI